MVLKYGSDGRSELKGKNETIHGLIFLLTPAG